MILASETEVYGWRLAQQSMCSKLRFETIWQVVHQTSINSHHGGRNALASIKKSSVHINLFIPVQAFPTRASHAHRCSPKLLPVLQYSTKLAPVGVEMEMFAKQRDWTNFRRLQGAGSHCSQVVAISAAATAIITEHAQEGSVPAAVSPMAWYWGSFDSGARSSFRWR